MSRSWQLVTFDVYTALFDVEGSLVPVVNRTLGAQFEALALVRTWRSKQLEYALISNSLQRGRLAFSVATRRALDYALGRAGLEVSERPHATSWSKPGTSYGRGLRLSKYWLRSRRAGIGSAPSPMNRHLTTARNRRNMGHHDV